MNTIAVPDKKKIIILGARGHIGSALFSHLTKKTALLNVRGTSRNLCDDKDIIQFNPFTDDWQFLGKADVLVNCIGIIREDKKNNFSKVHISLTKLMISNRAIMGNPIIIHLSALGATKNHPVKFLRTKGIADDLLLKQQNIYVIRPSIVCFPETLLLQKIIMLRNIAKKIRSRLLLPKGFLNKYVQPVLIEDLTEIISSIITKGNAKFSVINVVGFERMSYRDIIGKAENKLKITEINQQLFATLVKLFIGPLFPSILNYDQYQLLFYDNIADDEEVIEILGRHPSSTKKFWQKNLTDND